MMRRSIFLFTHSYSVIIRRHYADGIKFPNKAASTSKNESNKTKTPKETTGNPKAILNKSAPNLTSAKVQAATNARPAAVAASPKSNNTMNMKPSTSPRPSTLRLFAGSSHPDIANRISKHLGIPLGKATTKKFSNKETQVRIEESVRGDSVYIIQTGGGDVNDKIVELCIMINACKVASADNITAVIPCFPYARQDNCHRARASITAKLVANIISVAGAQHVITMDLHASQIQGFFNIPCDNLYADFAIKRWVTETIPNWKESVMVSPDAGGVKRMLAIADSLDIAFAIVHNERQRGKDSSSILVGDVKNKTAIIIDDIIDVANTIVNAAAKLKESGAKKVYAVLTHGTLSGNAIEKINSSCLESLVVTNTLPQDKHKELCPKLVVIDISDMLAESIRLSFHADSISKAFG